MAKISCPRCAYETYADLGSTFAMPDEHAPCIYLREQAASGGITEWQCPYLTQEVERVLHDRHS
jgi:hypothetical protein